MKNNLNYEQTKILIELLQKQYPEYFGIIAKFNYFPAEYLHKSRRKDYFNNQLVDFFWDSGISVPRISSLLLSELSLETRPYLKIPDPNWSFALLSTERLGRIAFFIGAALCGPHVRACLSRDQVLVWQTKLGQDGFQFALNSTLLFSKEWLSLSIDTTGDIQNLGYGVIVNFLDEVAEEMKRRIILKIPSPLKNPGIDHYLAKKIVYAVFSFLEPEWHASFTSIHQ